MGATIKIAHKTTPSLDLCILIGREFLSSKLANFKQNILYRLKPGLATFEQLIFGQFFIRQVVPRVAFCCQTVVDGVHHPVDPRSTDQPTTTAAFESIDMQIAGGTQRIFCLFHLATRQQKNCRPKKVCEKLFYATLSFLPCSHLLQRNRYYGAFCRDIVLHGGTEKNYYLSPAPTMCALKI